MNHLRRFCSVAAMALAATLACDGDVVQPPPENIPGTLVLTLMTPNTDDGAILLSVAGGEINSPMAAASSHVLFFRTTSESSINAVIVGDITDGLLIHFDVPDVASASSYNATVTQVADRGNTLRNDISGYLLDVAVQ